MVAYLLASLPTPRLGETPEVGVDTVLERSTGFVGKERALDLAWVLGISQNDGRRAESPTGEFDDAPAAEHRPPLTDTATVAWARITDLVEDAIAAERCARARIDAHPYLRRPAGYRVDVAEGVAAAFDRPNPGARERHLDELRWRLADELRVGDSDGFGALVARAAQLRLAWRWSGWNDEDGWKVLEAAQRRIEERHG
jgi:hypothetical protein